MPVDMQSPTGDWVRACCDNEELREQLSTAESSAARWRNVSVRLAEALRAIEWQEFSHNSVALPPDQQRCYWCKNIRTNGHHTFCYRQSVLAAYGEAVAAEQGGDR